MIELVAEVSPRLGILEKDPDLRNEVLLRRIVVIHQREDLRIHAGRRNRASHLVLSVHRVHTTLVDQRIRPIVDAEVAQGPVRRDHMQPLGEQKIDLPNVLLERRVTRRIVLHVVRRAQTFALVQRNLGGRQVAAAMGRMMQLLALAQRYDRRRRRPVVALGVSQQKLRQRPHPQQTNDEDRPNDQSQQRERIEDPAQALPAFPLRIIKNLLRHSPRRSSRERLLAAPDRS